MLKHIESDTLLYLDGISKSFDGFKALNNLSLMVKPGELRAIIGPNGAGKTTMMDVITGKLRPDEGELAFAGQDLSQLDEADVARLGIGRKFQKPSVIEQLTVEQNLDLALAGSQSLWQLFAHRLSKPLRQRRQQILEMIALTERRNALAGSLSHGQKQWLELGMLLSQDPQLLLIDEPAAGMTDEETARTAELFKSLAGQHALVVVEHDMEFIEALDCSVTVLHEGSVLAEGALDVVKNDARVIDVYLGR